MWHFLGITFYKGGNPNQWESHIEATVVQVEKPLFRPKRNERCILAKSCTTFGWLKHVETCWNPWFSFTTSLNWCRIWQPSMVSHTQNNRCISHHIPLYSHDTSSKSHGQIKKKPGDLSEASFNDPTDLHCSFIFQDVALGRTENLRREAWTVKNSGDGTYEERMESQILVKYM